MDKNDSQKFNTLFDFLNKIFSQSVISIKDFLRKNVLSVDVVNFPEKQVVSIDNINKLIDEIKSAIQPEKKNIDANSVKDIVINQPDKLKIETFNGKELLEALDSVKEEIQNSKVEIPEFPNHLSFDEAGDVIEVLQSVVKEIKKQETKPIDLSIVEKELISLKSFIPKISDLKIPMEKGRIKVILPNDQVMPRTTLGEKVKKATGQFLGGTTKNPYVQIHGPAGSVINPATEETLNSIKEEVEAKGSVGDGTRSVTTAGTAVQLSATSVPVKRVWIQASDGNSGTIVVGGSTVVASQATRRGKALFAGWGDWFNINNLNLLWLDSTTNTQKISFYYEK